MNLLNWLEGIAWKFGLTGSLPAKTFKESRKCSKLTRRLLMVKSKLTEDHLLSGDNRYSRRLREAYLQYYILHPNTTDVRKQTR